MTPPRSAVRILIDEPVLAEQRDDAREHEAVRHELLERGGLIAALRTQGVELLLLGALLLKHVGEHLLECFGTVHRCSYLRIKATSCALSSAETYRSTRMWRS